MLKQNQWEIPRNGFPRQIVQQRQHSSPQRLGQRVASQLPEDDAVSRARCIRYSPILTIARLYQVSFFRNCLACLERISQKCEVAGDGRRLADDLFAYRAIVVGHSSQSPVQAKR